MLKSETKHEDMLSIMDHLHQYVPMSTEEYAYRDPENGEDVPLYVDHSHRITFGKTVFSCFLIFCPVKLSNVLCLQEGTS